MIGGPLRTDRGSSNVSTLSRTAGDTVRAVRRFSLLLAIPIFSACAEDRILGFEIGDVGGLWIASSYEYVSNASSSERVDIVERDGALFTLSVDDSVQPPIVGSTLDDGTGAITNRSGTVDIRDGLITLGDATFGVVHDGDPLMQNDVRANGSKRPNSHGIGHGRRRIDDG